MVPFFPFYIWLTTAAGDIQGAWLSIGIGMRLSQSAKLNAESPTRPAPSNIEERRRCFWSLYLLEMICSHAFASSQQLVGCRPPYPSSLELKPIDNLELGQPGGGNNHGIIGYSIELLELWQTTLNYATGQTSPKEAPWSPNSEHFQLAARIMEWEANLCKHHRSAHTKFREQDLMEVRANLRYWGPWILVQFTYPATLCLLHHPFFLSERAKDCVGRVSLSFLETSMDLALLHSKHITRMITRLDHMNMGVSDPFLAYCATVAATIDLWYCYVEDRGVKAQARRRFAICYRFIRAFAEKWPIAQKMVCIWFQSYIYRSLEQAPELTDARLIISCSLTLRRLPGKQVQSHHLLLLRFLLRTQV
jgi:hypothetical protein